MNIQGALKIHLIDKWSWVYIPLIILMSSFLFGLILSFIIPVEEKILVTGFSYVFIYMLIMGIVSFNQTFSFAMGMSLRRTDYFIGLSLISLGSGLLFSIAFVLLAFLENSTNGWGGRLAFFHLQYLNDGNIFDQFAVYFIVMVHLFFLGLLFSVFTKRFGLKGLLTLGLSIFFSISLAVLLLSYFEVWGDLFHWIVEHTAVQLAFWLIPFTFFYAVCSYWMLRRTQL